MNIRDFKTFIKLFLAPPSVFFEKYIEIGLNSNFKKKKSTIIHE